MNLILDNIKKLDFKMFLKKQKGFTLIELLISLSIVSILSMSSYTSLQSARTLSRDLIRLNDIKQISLAMELNRNNNTENYNFTSASTPFSIGEELVKVPQNNFVDGLLYKWLDNTSTSSEFCVWATLEKPEFGDFYIGNPYGRGFTDYEPTNFFECRFYKTEHTINNSNSSDETFELCHFPGNDPDKQKTIIIPNGEGSGHLNNHPLDHTGRCLNESTKKGKK